MLNVQFIKNYIISVFWNRVIIRVYNKPKVKKKFLLFNISVTECIYIYIIKKAIKFIRNHEISIVGLFCFDLKEKENK